MDNRLTLYQTALECLGKDMAPYEDEFGCAEAVNAVFKKAFGRDIGGGQSTYWLYGILKNDTRFEKNFSPLPGDIIISPTGYGNKKKLRNGHIGIVSDSEQIMSNNSINGLWEKNYTFITWTRRYKIFGNYPVEFFRVKTPQLAPTAPTIPIIDAAPRITVNPPLFAQPAWLENLIWRTRNSKLGNTIFGDRTFGAARSPSWQSFRKSVLAGKSCAVCGGTKKLELHHIQSFAQHQDLELEPTNVIPLCESKKWGVTCHQFFGHLGDYKDINPDIRKDAELWKTKLSEARKVV